MYNICGCRCTHLLEILGDTAGGIPGKHTGWLEVADSLVIGRRWYFASGFEVEYQKHESDHYKGAQGTCHQSAHL